MDAVILVYFLVGMFCVLSFASNASVRDPATAVLVSWAIIVFWSLYLVLEIFSRLWYNAR